MLQCIVVSFYNKSRCLTLISDICEGKKESGRGKKVKKVPSNENIQKFTNVLIYVNHINHIIKKYLSDIIFLIFQ